MRASVSFAALLAVTAVLAPACKGFEEPPPPPFQVAITVESDKGSPLADAVVTRTKKEIARTDATGRAVLTFRGEDGDQLDVYVKCPEGYDSPLRPVTVALKRLADPKRLAEYPVSCPPSERKVVVALRTENGPNLAVKYLGRDVARTDESGAATFMMNAKPGDHLDFTIDTSDKAAEKLRPQNPSVSLVVDSKDAFYTLDQVFQVQHTRVIVVAPHRPQPIGPTPLRY
jgi:hypothetical protein